MIAVKLKRLDIVELLVKARAGASAIPPGSNSVNNAFRVAVQQGETDIVKVLLKAGPDLESQGSRGLTPLLIAVKKVSLSMIQLLLSAGASPASIKRRDLLVSTCGWLYVDKRCQFF